MKSVVLVLVFLFTFYVLYSVALFAWRVHLSSDIKKNATAFEREVSGASYKVLIIGDSTAFGTGAVDNKESVAGLLATDHPEVSIKNLGENGLKTGELISKFEELEEGEHFDLMIVHIGGNDIIYLTKTESLEKDLPMVLDMAKARADNVVLITSGDVGFAPIFPQPLALIMSHQSEKILGLFSRVAKEKGVLWVDLYADESGRPYTASDIVEGFYAKDLIHPSAIGYKAWYGEILKTLEKGGVELPQT